MIETDTPCMILRTKLKQQQLQNTELDNILFYSGSFVCKQITTFPTKPSVNHESETTT